MRSLKATKPESAEDGLCRNRSRTERVGTRLAISHTQMVDVAYKFDIVDTDY